MGRPAATKLQARRCPHTRQVASGPWKQPSQRSPSPSWARRATGRSRPQREQGRFGRGAQTAHRASPDGPRPPTGLTPPQRAQATASSRRRQRGHNPPVAEAVNLLWARPQRPQAGWGRPDPLARSSATNLPTSGGAPLSRAAGPGSSALASTDSALELVATASMAELTSLALSPVPTSVKRRATRSLRACCCPGITPGAPLWPDGGGYPAPLLVCSPA
jgi:hypothetical protein